MYTQHPSSFRDPSGFIFENDGEIYRQVNLCYKEHYDLLMHSGLYDVLVSKKYLTQHTETEFPHPQEAYKILKPERIPVISYPYEWCFSQLKDAALLTLEIQRIALEHGMTLKDSSAYNIQFIGCRPIFIDTLSFEKYQADTPWIAYRQYCEHFLTTLALVKYVDNTLQQLLYKNINGIPLEFATKMLPLRTWLNIHLFIHIHLHAINKNKNDRKAISFRNNQKRFSKQSFFGLLNSLESIVSQLQWQNRNEGWDNYYKTINPKYYSDKLDIVKALLSKISPESVLDIGANLGEMSKLHEGDNTYTISIDSDYGCVELQYKTLKYSEYNILPLCMDILNPSPSLGWNSNERISFLDRKKYDLVMLLAIIHHMMANGNLSLSQILFFVKNLSHYAIIEYIPFDDPNIKKINQFNSNYQQYTEDEFQRVVSQYFTVIELKAIAGSERVLYLLKVK